MVNGRSLTQSQAHKYWASKEGTLYEVISTYSPNEDNDTWVEYKNCTTGQEYQCRLEAFQSRFTPRVDQAPAAKRQRKKFLSPSSHTSPIPLKRALYKGQCPFSRAVDTSPKLVYNAGMKWLIIALILSLQACAYTAVSTASFIVTGKSTTDHALTAVVPRADCNITNLKDDKYYCEVRDISRTYNRNGY